MTILAKRWGGPEEDDIIIEVSREKLKKHLDKLGIPYDAKSRNGGSFFPMVAQFAKLADNEYKVGAMNRSRYGVDPNTLEETEVTQSGFKKLQNTLKQYFKITLALTEDVINN